MKMKKLAVMALATALSVGSVMTASAAWLQEGGNWKYQNDNGTFQTGTWFQDVDGKWYHFDNNGNMQKGWFLDADGKWYFMAYHGAMQTGLIRVDNAVYFMNPSGDLFIGEKEISGVKYNFGLYGTTNGTPSVGQSATFGGNGNQTKPGGGGGSSSSGGSTTTETPIEKVQDSVNEVKGAVEAAKDNAKNDTVKDVKVAEPKQVGSTVVVAVSVEAVKVADKDVTPEIVEDVQNSIKEVASATISTVDSDADVVVDVPGFPATTYKASEWENKLDDMVDKFVDADYYKANKDKVAKITVPVDGVEVTYTISLNN